MSSARVIEESNLSVAWGKAFLEVVNAGELAPLVVVIKDLGISQSLEDATIRQAVDDALAAEGRGLSCNTVANTIFPSLWNPGADRSQLYERYRRILPRLRRYRRNRNGLYFERLISFGADEISQGGVNQLEHIIQTWNGGNHRRTALQAGVFDPHRDHTHQRQRGFPCLQQIAFAKDGDNGLTVTGFYATQYMFERAYGNYLGLYRLGCFMAHEMGLTLAKLTCIATPAVVGKGSRATLNTLGEQVGRALEVLSTAPSGHLKGVACD